MLRPSAAGKTPRGKPPDRHRSLQRSVPLTEQRESKGWTKVKDGASEGGPEERHGAGKGPAQHGALQRVCPQTAPQRR